MKIDNRWIDLKYFAIMHHVFCAYLILTLVYLLVMPLWFKESLNEH